MTDQVKAQRELMRWELIRAMDKNRPYTNSETFLLSIIQVIMPGATALELRRELDYLESRELAEIARQPSGLWFADLTRLGVDIAEYTVDCDAGIARPVKYWSA
ncbi:MAG TPA: hypothetical protein PKD73_06010 [Burkholderiaceae bacterium]|nr:hypothetical protein [Burkholderiaceae bacterium]